MQRSGIGRGRLLERPMAVERIPGFTEGEVSVQDAAAQYAAPRSIRLAGARCLRRAGGKPLTYSSTADVDLVALDNDPARLERVQSNLERLQLNARLVAATRLHPPPGGTDALLTAYSRTCRAPRPASCAAIPTSSGCADRATSRASRSASATSCDALWQLLASGGKLLYATCSVFHEENQAQIARFLERHRDARRLTLPGPHTNAQQLAGQILPDEHA